MESEKKQRLFCISLLVCTVLYVMPWAHAGNIIEAELVNKGQLVESHDPDVKVSGNIIVGVMIESAYQALSDDRIGIAFPGNTEQSLCLKVSSRDGIYTSENLYQFSAQERDMVYLPYQTTMQDTIEEYTEVPGSIAMAIIPGTCDNSAVTDYLLPAILDREKENLGKGKLALYINSIDATDVYYRVVESGKQDFSDCSYIEEGRHTSYNFVCEIDYQGPTRDDGSVHVEIEREIYGREITPGLTIHLLYFSQAMAGSAL